MPGGKLIRLPCRLRMADRPRYIGAPSGRLGERRRRFARNLDDTRRILNESCWFYFLGARARGLQLRRLSPG